MVARFKSVKKPGKKLAPPFKKGQPRPENAGRRKGVPNKNTRLIKDAITGAGARLGLPEPIYRFRSEKRKVGGKYKTVRVRTDEVIGWKATGRGGLEGYMVWLGLTHPTAYAGLVAKVLPLQINTKINNDQTVIHKYEKLDTSKMTLAEKQAVMSDMLSLTKPRALPAPKDDQGEYEEAEYEEVPANFKEAAE